MLPKTIKVETGSKKDTIQARIIYYKYYVTILKYSINRLLWLSVLMQGPHIKPQNHNKLMENFKDSTKDTQNLA